MIIDIVCLEWSVVAIFIFQQLCVHYHIIICVLGMHKLFKIYLSYSEYPCFTKLPLFIVTAAITVSLHPFLVLAHIRSAFAFLLFSLSSASSFSVSWLCLSMAFSSLFNSCWLCAAQCQGKRMSQRLRHLLPPFSLSHFYSSALPSTKQLFMPHAPDMLRFLHLMPSLCLPHLLPLHCSLSFLFPL